MKATLMLSLLATLPLLAQDPAPQLSCNDRGRHNDRASSCQMKEWTIATTGRLTVDSGTNGGVSVKGWSRQDTLVRAKIETWAPADAEAQSMQSQIVVETAGGNVRATGPDFGRDRGFAVSYEVFVPKRLDLSLTAHNGGIAINDVSGRIDFNTTNGGVSLKRVGGSVRGQTTNGGLSIELAGSRWEGDELDATTTNGGVSIAMPANYSARLDIGTVNGGFKSDVPMSVNGEIGKQITATIGAGGPLIKLRTTNGGIHIRQAS